MNISETDKSYIAGLFDGEGCIGYYNANPNPQGTPYCHSSVHISNTNQNVIIWVGKITGIGRSSTQKFKDGKRRTAYQWQLSKKAQVREFLEAIRPYLHVKAEQVDTLLELFKKEVGYIKKHGSVSSEVAALRVETVAKLKALKRAT